MSASTPIRRIAARGVQGFGLIELMISMVLGLLVMGAAFVVFQSNQTTYRANEGLNRMQENARVAFELMSRDIRAAGGSACSNKSFMQTTGAQATSYNDAITGVNDGNNSLASARDQVTATSGDDTAYRVSASTSSSVTIVLPPGLTTAADAFQVGDALLLCNARYTYVVTATGVSTNTISFAALPGGYDPTTDAKAPPAAVVLARFRDNRWFVGANGRGGNSLFVSRNGGAAQEVAEGVESLRVRYLEGLAGGVSYVDAPALWTNVTGVRMDMRLSGQNVDGRAFTRDFSNVVSLRTRNL
jgi:type IV pilus assembly protein PilW